MRPNLRTKRGKSRLTGEDPGAVEEVEEEVGAEEALGVAGDEGEGEDSRPVLLESDGFDGTKPSQSFKRRAG